MNDVTQRTVVFLAMICVVILATGSDTKEQSQALAASLSDVKDLRMPLEYFENGEIKSQLFAEKASIPANEDDSVKATGVRAEFYDEKGNVDITIKSDDCAYDRDSGFISSKGNLTVEKEGLYFSGDGYVWDSKKRHIKIQNNVKLTIRKGLKIGADSIVKGKDEKSE